MTTDEIPTLDIEAVRGHLYWAGYGDLEDVRDLYDFEAIRAGRQALAAYEHALAEIERLKAANANLINNANVLAGELVAREFEPQHSGLSPVGIAAALIAEPCSMCGGTVVAHTRDCKGAWTEQQCAQADHPMAVYNQVGDASVCACGCCWMPGDYRASVTA